MTGQELVASSMRLIGALASGEVPSAAEFNDMLGIANAMLDSWAAQRYFVFTVNRDEYPLTPGKQDYTYGPGGDFNAVRPAKINQISIISLQNPNQPLELPIDYLTDAQWQAIPVKNVQSALPNQVWDNGNYPLRVLRFWPIPTITVSTAIYPWVALNTFPSASQNVTFPPGYQEAIKYNLAVRAAPEFGMETSQTVATFALMSMAVVKSINVPIIDLHCDPGVVNPKTQIYDWRSDTWARR